MLSTEDGLFLLSEDGISSNGILLLTEDKSLLFTEDKSFHKVFRYLKMAPLQMVFCYLLKISSCPVVICYLLKIVSLHILLSEDAISSNRNLLLTEDKSLLLTDDKIFS